RRRERSGWWYPAGFATVAAAVGCEFVQDDGDWWC
ncbi:hypothetical protein A2U01_0056677, partial [Trifolium medium]|nr:hypothetical protein [Trifolium medium]